MTKSYEPEILNAALEFATEWGDNFRQPIAARMLRRFTNLNGEEIAEIEKYVRSVEYRIYEIAEMEERSEISEGEITRIAANEFPWLDPTTSGG